MEEDNLTPHKRIWTQSLSGISAIDLFPFRKTTLPYQRENISGDLRAGFNVALLAFPQGMAYALIAGLPIEYGLYGSVIACIIGPLFASSHFITLGPTNATSVMVMSAFASLGMTAAVKLSYLPLMLLLVGAFLIVGAYLKVANLIQFISRSVVVGYISAAALMIIANQLKNVFGFSLHSSATSFVQVIYQSLLSIPDIHLASLSLSLITLAIYFILQWKLRFLPNVAISLVASSLIAHFFFTQNGIPLQFLNALDLADGESYMPDFSLEAIETVVGPAFAIALLSVLEGTSIGKSLAARAGARLDANQEMFSIGVANIGCGLLGGMPASGSLTRSVLNWTSGGKTPLASIISGLICLIGTLLLADYIQYIPKTALAVLVICIGISLINKHAIRLVCKTTQSDCITFIITILTGLIFALDTAIYVGMTLSIILFLKKAAAPEMVEYCFTDDGALTELDEKKKRNTASVSIVHVEGNLFFGASELFRDQVRRVCEDPQLRIVILKMRNAHNVDATSMMALEELIKFMNERGRYLIITEAKSSLIRVFQRSGLYNIIGEDFIFEDDSSNTTKSTALGLQRAQELLGDDIADVSIYYNRCLDENQN